MLLVYAVNSIVVNTYTPIIEYDVLSSLTSSRRCRSCNCEAPMQALLLFLAIILSVLLAIPLSDVDRGQVLQERNEVVAFYHIYLGGHFREIVEEQITTIKGNGLLGRLNKVFYATMGPNASDFGIDEPTFVHLVHYGDEGEEIETLSLLYRFCHANPDSKVLYFHDKGSLHNTTQNENFRQMLNCFVLNPNCLETLDSHDVCGWRISPVPFIHYSGNFWWARCSYINTLVDPLSPKVNQTYIALAESLNSCVGVKGRYFAETWIGTAPTIHPADCMNSSVENSYIAYTYNMPEGARPYCHGPGMPSGLPCTTASTFTHPTHFKEAIHSVLFNRRRRAECRDNRREVTRRTQILYGQEPHTYLDWMQRLAQVDPQPPNNTLVKFRDGQKRLYLMLDGVLHAVPDKETREALRLPHHNVTYAYSTDKPGFTFGPSLRKVKRGKRRVRRGGDGE